MSGTSFDPERIARIFRVPYWLVSDAPRPSWLRRPVWRLRAVWWRLRDFFGVG